MSLEPMQQAIARLERRGYVASFRAEAEGLRVAGEERLFAPEDLGVDEWVRFEGESDPQDEAILVALSSPSGDVRGTWVVYRGPGLSPADAEMLRRLAGRGSPEGG